LPNLDRLGALMSFTCAVHCVVFPVLLLSLPWLGATFLYDRKIEFFFIGGSIFLATLSYSYGFHFHREMRLLLVLYLCTGMIVAGKLLIGGVPGLWLAVPGALGLAAGHLVNLRLCRHCRGEHHHAG
jgi:hypothetical protein